MRSYTVLQITQHALKIILRTTHAMRAVGCLRLLWLISKCNIITLPALEADSST